MNPEEHEEHEERNGFLATAPRRPARTSSMPTLTCQEWAAFQVLRRRYREGQDLWDAREPAYLRFLRWLRNAGRIES